MQNILKTLFFSLKKLYLHYLLTIFLLFDNFNDILGDISPLYESDFFYFNYNLGDSSIFCFLSVNLALGDFIISIYLNIQFLT
jgi:hypothetical protein